MRSLIFYFQLYLMPLLQNDCIPILNANSTLWLGYEQEKNGHTQMKKKDVVSSLGDYFYLNLNLNGIPKSFSLLLTNIE